MPIGENDFNFTTTQYPGTPPKVTAKLPACSSTPTPSLADGLNPSGGTGFAPCAPYEAEYSEKLLIGYRYYDAHELQPAFPFGHGLSFTTFKYSNIQATRHAVTVTVSNSGTVMGSEVAQLYLSFPEVAEEPPRQLKGFMKTRPLSSGGSVTVTFQLNDRSFSIWDTTSHAWKVVSGSFGVHVGASSRDIRQQATILI